MSLSNSTVVDSVGIDEESGDVVLSIIDEGEWGNPEHHAGLLSEKLNRYLGFIEGGELIAAYPEAKGCATRIDVIFRFEPPNSLALSLKSAAEVVASYGCSLTWRVYAA